MKFYLYLLVILLLLNISLQVQSGQEEEEESQSDDKDESEQEKPQDDDPDVKATQQAQKSLEEAQQKQIEELKKNPNPYKDIASVKHSLYKERNDQKGRISGTWQGVPPGDLLNQQRIFEDPGSLTAFKTAYWYNKVFDECDKTGKGQISLSEIVSAFNDNKWIVPDGESIDSYVKKQMTKFDHNGDQKLDIYEFIQLLEALFDVEQQEFEKECLTDLEEAYDVFRNLFKYLDQDRNGMITKENWLHGMAYLMHREMNEDDVEKAFKLFDEDKDGHLDWLEFIGSVDNDILTANFDVRK